MRILNIMVPLKVTYTDTNKIWFINVAFCYCELLANVMFVVKL